MNEIQFASELGTVDQSQPEQDQFQEEQSEDSLDSIQYQLILYEEAIAIFNFENAMQLYSECK
jgi:hypothetical protein